MKDWRDECYCKKFIELVEDGTIRHGEEQLIGMTKKNQWYIVCNIEWDCGAAGNTPIMYCPFCGKKLNQEE